MDIALLHPRLGLSGSVQGSRYGNQDLLHFISRRRRPRPGASHVARTSNMFLLSGHRCGEATGWNGSRQNLSQGPFAFLGNEVLKEVLGTYRGASYNYSYDSMYRLDGMTTSGGTTVVSGVSYNAANQLLGMTFNGTTETRSYNVLGQLTGLRISSQLSPNCVKNLTYNYPTGTNNGKVSSMYNAVSGETVTYAYDSLNRMATAAGSGWGETYTLDPYGNLTTKQVTSGSGPSLSVNVNQSTNQIQGYGFGYDANGNSLLSSNGTPLAYDAENRVSAVGWSNNPPVVDYSLRRAEQAHLHVDGRHAGQLQQRVQLLSGVLLAERAEAGHVPVGSAATGLSAQRHQHAVRNRFAGVERSIFRRAAAGGDGSVGVGGDLLSVGRGEGERQIRRTPGATRRIGGIRRPGWITRIIDIIRMCMGGS